MVKLIAAICLIACAIAVPVTEAPKTAVQLIQLEAPVTSSVDVRTVTAEVATGQYLNVADIRRTQSAIVDPSNVHTCTAPSDSQYVVTPCSSTSDTVVHDCTKTIAAGHFVLQACVHGDWKTAGSDTVIQDCTVPVTGTTYTTQACTAGDYTTAGHDTILANCLTQIPSGSYVSQACAPGSSSARGSNTVTGYCSTPRSGQSFVTAACVPGSSSHTGTDTVISDCSPVSSGHFVATACHSGSYSATGTDTGLTACATPVTGTNFVSASCQSGTTGYPGSDTGLTACTAPVAGTSYVSTACAPGSPSAIGKDTAIKTCQTPTAGTNFVDTICVAGDTQHIGSDTHITRCSTVPGSQYVTATCDAGSTTHVGSDNTFAACTAPTNGVNYVTTACVTGSSTARGSDTVVASCTSPTSGHHTTAVCNPGSTSTTGSNTVIADCTAATSGQNYVSAKCAMGSTTALGSDTGLTNCRSASTGSTYVSQGCTSGSTSQLGTDTGLSTCSTCSSSQYQVSACTASANTVCADITTDQPCEGSTLSLSCPSGLVIHITAANYGRTSSSVCPGPNQQNTNCASANTLGIVQNACEGKASCSVGANNNVFGDPCGGTYKYLQVSHACVSSTLELSISATDICEGSTLNIDCGSGKHIQIDSANYGRLDSSICPGQNQGTTTNCKASSSMTNVQAACDGKQSCSVGANNNVFGDPCYGVYKYLATAYTCKNGAGTAAAAAPAAAPVCEGNTLNIDCGYGKSIHISSANYGRSDASVCPGQNQATTGCAASNSLTVVRNSCDGKQSCSVGANNNVFGDPCYGVYKYLQVAYSCS